MIKRSALGAILGLFLSGTALAAPAAGDWYAGFGIGSAERDTGDNATAWHLFGGYEMRNRLAFEADYLSLGEYSSGNASIDGLALTALGTLPLSARVSLQGKLGLFFWTYDRKRAPKVSYNGMDPTYGLLLRIQADPKIMVRLGWQKLPGVHDADMTLVTGDLVYFFK